MGSIEITTSAGRVRGLVEQGITTFKGIPYAEPPFGPNLLRPPVSRAPWEGVRDCTSYGPCCPQPVEQAIMSRPVEAGEDCLSVNVWAPEGAKGLPVMFWIHGGAYIYGSNADLGFEGDAFARDGVVFVSCNYRLGALGFLHAGYLDDSYSVCSGSYGLADQIAALQWVYNNIGAFGGDPNNVTIFGCSAGGTYVTSLLGCPSAQGLFRRVISESAGGSPLFGFSHNIAEPVAKIILQKVGVAAKDLPTVDPMRIVEAQVELMAEIQRGERDAECGEMTIPFVPLIGGDLMPRSAHEAIADGVGSNVDLVIGTNRDENSTFELMAEIMGTNAGIASLEWGADPKVRQRIFDVYDSTQQETCPINAKTSMTSDRLFRIPSLRIAEARARADGSTRVYMYAWRTPAFEGRIGAGHGLECPFVFDNFAAPMMTMMLGDSVPPNLAGEMHGSWIAFARTGDPAAGGAVPAWPQYDLVNRPTMVFDEKSRVVDDPDGARRAAWDGVEVRV
jgi:para-nitrobenzyl esterase